MAKRKTTKKDTVKPKPGTKRRTMAKRKINTKRVLSIQSPIQQLSTH